MIKRLFFVMVLLASLAGGLYYFKVRQMQAGLAARQPPPPPVVALSQVREESWMPFWQAVGTLAAINGTALSTEVAGVVSAIHFQSGQRVTKGQALMELDATTDRAELTGLQAAQKLAHLKFQRAARLLPERSMSQADYDEARAVLDETEAKVVAKQASIDKKTLRAPFTGLLGLRQVNLGQYLAPGTPVVRLETQDPIYCDFSLPERYVSQVRRDQELTAKVQTYPDRTFSGQISAIEPGIDVSTRSVRVRATLSNSDGALHSGMFADVQVLQSAARRVLTLPDTAITYTPYGHSVFLVQDTDAGLQVQRRQVETGEVRSGRVVIRSGLAVGDRVVSAGQVKLRNGMKIVPDQRPAPGEREPKP